MFSIVSHSAHHSLLSSQALTFEFAEPSPKLIKQLQGSGFSCQQIQVGNKSLSFQVIFLYLTINFTSSQKQVLIIEIDSEHSHSSWSWFTCFRWSKAAGFQVFKHILLLYHMLHWNRIGRNATGILQTVPGEVLVLTGQVCDHWGWLWRVNMRNYSPNLWVHKTSLS